MISITITGETAAEVLEQLRGLMTPSKPIKKGYFRTEESRIAASERLKRRWAEKSVNHTSQQNGVDLAVPARRDSDGR